MGEGRGEPGQLRRAVVCTRNWHNRAAAHRRHCRSGLQLLRSSGIANINMDLIAGLPYQTLQSWCESLDSIERSGPPHVSVYLFEVDEDSRLGPRDPQWRGAIQRRCVPDRDRMADLYETAVDRLRGMGIERYEISNFARPVSSPGTT